MAISAPRDNNRVPALMGVSSSDGVTPTLIYVDPVTHRVLVDMPAVSSGVVAPSTTPTALGQTYINTATGSIYISNGTSSSANWVVVN